MANSPGTSGMVRVDIFFSAAVEMLDIATIAMPWPTVVRASRRVMGVKRLMGGSLFEMENLSAYSELILSRAGDGFYGLIGFHSLQAAGLRHRRGRDLLHSWRDSHGRHQLRSSPLEQPRLCLVHLSLCNRVQWSDLLLPANERNDVLLRAGRQCKPEMSD